DRPREKRGGGARQEVDHDGEEGGGEQCDHGANDTAAPRPNPHAAINARAGSPTGRSPANNGSRMLIARSCGVGSKPSYARRHPSRAPIVALIQTFRSHVSCGHRTAPAGGSGSATVTAFCPGRIARSQNSSNDKPSA